MKRSIFLTLSVSAGLLVGACADSKNNDDTGVADGTADDDGSGPGTGADGGDTNPFDDGGSVDGGPDTGTAGPSDETVGPSDESESSGGGMTGVGFITRNDGGGMVSFECDLFAQDCPAGEKCMPYSNDGGPAWNATRCSPINANPGAVGDPCTVEGGGLSGIDSCDIGLMCWNVDAKGAGVCEDMCTGSVDAPLCEDPDDVCAIANDGAISLCLSACDPLIQDCAIENEVCYPINDSWACAPDASGDKAGAYGDPCEFINACDEGFICVGAGGFTACAGGGCCTQVCDHMSPTSDEECAALDPGQLCEAWYLEGQAPPGYENVGACLVPA